MTSNPSVLIVDDDSTLRAIMMDELAAEGFSMDEAANFDQAFEKLNQHSYDVALVDLHLPGGSGVDILKFISSSMTSCKAITMTGACRRDAVESMDHGAADFVSKPFEIEELIAAIRTVLRQDVVVS